MIAILSLSLIGCITKTEVSNGDFCDVYSKIDIPWEDVSVLERKYQERILYNELFYEKCF